MSIRYAMCKMGRHVLRHKKQVAGRNENNGEKQHSSAYNIWQEVHPTSDGHQRTEYKECVVLTWHRFYFFLPSPINTFLTFAMHSGCLRAMRLSTDVGMPPFRSICATYVTRECVASPATGSITQPEESTSENGGGKVTCDGEHDG